ncbi:LPD7 domain-containing protein [Roseateles cellulosilyticus]|uniref:Large polyvalent protein-associated domain-containing protein n=1 Tax=Pelomonas cellulosilytica TaxID=2906762 RepID=A0ABS8XZE8_9BURK|nr:LPD7 domain-containing protein [Pelomonas sp. P8]MCE4557994.1 hypothetical protein [Pelomonas sp. P8]
MAKGNTPSATGSSTPGGVVEPANRAAVANQKVQPPAEVAAERYELRDPSAQVVYRPKSLEATIAKADELGSSGFTIIAPDGSRTAIKKVGDEWRRGTTLAARHERPSDPGPARGETHGAPGSLAAQTDKDAKQQGQADAQALAKIDLRAERQALVAKLEESLKERYIIKRAPVSAGPVIVGHREYRFRGDSSRIAFTESMFKLATDINSPFVARSMVDVAQTRNWGGLRVSGSEDFRRLVWLEASVRGLKAVGYEPNPVDLDVLRREQQARLTNRIEPTRNDADDSGSQPTAKGSARGSGGRKAVMAAMEAVLIDKGVSQAKRNAVLAVAEQKLAELARRGQTTAVKVYDKAAQPQRPTQPQTPEPGRVRDRQVPALLR